MTTRWWSADKGSLTPDRFDLALLEPGQDSDRDLASALLVVHRTGEAACRAAAAQPMLDERTLLTHLATSRAAVALPAVEAISKSLGDSAYSGLLVRDVYDDAERTALSLFRAAVAKGVAPPIAAQRVGMVYGVSDEHLSTYRPLAVDPRVNPAVLLDAADRALFTFVEATAAAESEPVVKAEAWETEPRDTGGQWTKTKTRTNALTAIPGLEDQLRQVGKPAEPVPAARPERRERRERSERSERHERTERSEAKTPAEPRSKTRIKTRIRTKTVPGALRTSADRTKIAMEQQRQRLKGDEFVNRSTAPRNPSVNDLYFPLDVPLNYVVGESQHMSLLKSQSFEGSKGYVSGQDIIDSLGDANVAGSIEDQNVQGKAAEHISRLWGGAHAEVISRDEAKNSLVRRVIKEQLANRVLQEDDIFSPDEPDYHRQMDELVEETKEMSLWSPDHEIDHSQVALVVDDQANRAPRVPMWIVTGSEGYVEGESMPQYRISPYQKYEVLEPTELWDEHNQVIMVVSGLQSVGYINEVGKAEAWQSERRDESGRWTTTATRSSTVGGVDLDALFRQAQQREEAPVRTERPAARQERSERRERSQRTERSEAPRTRTPVPRTVPRTQDRTRIKTLAPKAQQVLERQLTRIRTERQSDEAPRVLADSDHVVMGLQDLYSVMRRTGLEPKEVWAAIADGDSLQMGREAQAALMSYSPVKGAELDDKLHYATDEQIDRNEDSADARDLFGHAVYINPEDEESVAALVDNIYDQFESDPSLHSITIEPTDSFYVQVKGNAKPIDDLVVVEYDDSVNLDDSIELKYLGTYRSGDLRHQVDRVIDPFQPGHGPYQAGVRYYKITNASYRRYRGTAR